MTCEPLTFFPCKHKKLFKCDCIKDTSLDLYRYHNATTCTSELHQNFKNNGYYKSPQPAWKYDCQNPFSKPEYQNILETVCKNYCLNCSCEKTYICELCYNINHRFKQDRNVYKTVKKDCPLETLVIKSFYVGTPERPHPLALAEFTGQILLDHHKDHCELSL